MDITLPNHEPEQQGGEGAEEQRDHEYRVNRVEVMDHVVELPIQEGLPEVSCTSVVCSFETSTSQPCEECTGTSVDDRFNHLPDFLNYIKGNFDAPNPHVLGKVSKKVSLPKYHDSSKTGQQSRAAKLELGAIDTGDVKACSVQKMKVVRGRGKQVLESLKIPKGNDSEDEEDNVKQSGTPDSNSDTYLSAMESPNVGDPVCAGKLAAELDAEFQQQCASNPWDCTALAPLEWMLNEVVTSLQPSSDDYSRRQYVILHLSNLVQSLDTCKGAEIVAFGSFESNFFTPWGDLDLTLELPADQEASPALTKSKKVKVLKSIERALAKSGVVRRLQLISRARVPLLMFIDTEVGIACDVSIDNGNALYKSRVLRWVTDLDPRCRQLIFLIKCWAKAQNINDPKLGTLNSYAISLLVVFHLQTRTPPILPSFKAILGDDIEVQGTERLDKDSQMQRMDECYNRIEKLKTDGFGQDNKSSIAQLFLSFFGQFARVNSLWTSGLTVSTYLGDWGHDNPSWTRKQYQMRVEDPFDLMDNCARSVQDISLPVICESFSEALDALSQPPNWDDLSSLRNTLFCWPPGTPQPGVHVRRFPVANLTFWKSKAEHKAGKKGQQQSIKSRRARRAEKPLAEKPNLGMTSLLEVETGASKWTAIEDQQQRSKREVLETRERDIPVDPVVQASRDTLEIGHISALNGGVLKTPEAGISGAREEQVTQKKPSRKAKKNLKKIGAEQLALFAENWVLSQQLRENPSNHVESGVEASPINNVPGEQANRLPFPKRRGRKARTQKARISGGVLEEGVQLSRVQSPDARPIGQQPQQHRGLFRQNHQSEVSEPILSQRPEYGLEGPSFNSHPQQRPGQGPSRPQRYNRFDGENTGFPQEPRYKQKRYIKRQSNAGVDQNPPGACGMGLMEHPTKERETAGRQGIPSPALCVKGPPTREVGL